MVIKLKESDLIDMIRATIDETEAKYKEDEWDESELDEDEELEEQDDGSEAGTSSAGQGAGTASMGVWQSGLARGVANQLGATSQSSGYAAISRGKANPLWENYNKPLIIKESELVNLIKKTINKLKGIN